MTWPSVTRGYDPRQAERLAHGFMALGLDHGDRIGIWGTNVLEWQLTQYAAAKAGLALVSGRTLDDVKYSRCLGF